MRDANGVPHERMPDAEFKQALTELIPHLRAFSRSLCGDPALSDDLAQDAMLKAWAARDSFVAGTNMKAWCFTILRNLFYSEKRRSWRTLPLDPTVAEATLVASDDAGFAIELLALKNAMALLPDDQREAVVLVGAGGLSYEEAASICGCAVGTIKSRVSRGRKALLDLLETNKAGFNSDKNSKAEDAFPSLVDEADRIVSDSTG